MFLIFIEKNHVYVCVGTVCLVFYVCSFLSFIFLGVDVRVGGFLLKTGVGVVELLVLNVLPYTSRPRVQNTHTHTHTRART